MITLIVLVLLALTSLFVMFKLTFGTAPKHKNKKLYNWIGILCAFATAVMVILALFGISLEDKFSPNKDPFGDKPMWDDK